MSILDQIIDCKRKEVATAKRARPERDLLDALSSAPPVRDFHGALIGPASIQLIAEVKRRSPSAGLIREDFDPVETARIYEAHGAACISVLTDEQFFGGHLDYLTEIRGAVNCPLLRKEFIIDSYQLLESRCAGADAILLIAECLDDAQLRDLHDRTCELGMTPLVEFHEPNQCARVIELGAKLIGVNNRDLHTFETDLAHTITMRRRIPGDRGLVSESGIRTHDDLVRLQAERIDAVLVGEHLMREADLGLAVRRLLDG